MHRWWEPNSLGHWKQSIQGESIWGWDELRVAKFKQCARCDVVCLKTAMIFRRLLKSCAHTWGLKDQVKL
jgi:hypothetical protein